MATPAELNAHVNQKLDELVNEKSTLAVNLSSNGVEATQDEKFDTLVPKVNEVYAAGKKSEYDTFWDSFQNNGNRTSYSFAFAEDSNYSFWSKGFTPKYPIKLVYSGYGSKYLFYYFGYNTHTAIDLSDFMKKNNITFYCNLYNLPSTDYIPIGEHTFRYSYFSHLPKLLVYYALDYTFYGCSKLVTIDELRFNGSANTSYYPFTNCNLLENVNFTGTLKGNGMNLSSSTKLTHDSIMSLINILYDYSSTTTKKVLTLGTTNLAKLTADEKAIATAKNWTLS